jgi:hypothetical protein
MTDSAFPTPREKYSLSEVTQKNKKAMLGTSLLAWAILEAAVRPRSISGTVEGEVDLVALLEILWWVILYLVSTFLIHSLSDYFSWRETSHLSLKRDRYRRSILKEEELALEEQIDEQVDKEEGIQRFHGKVFHYIKLAVVV